MRYVKRFLTVILTVLLLSNLLFTQAMDPADSTYDQNPAITENETGSSSNTDSSAEEQESPENVNEDRQESGSQDIDDKPVDEVEEKETEKEPDIEEPNTTVPEEEPEEETEEEETEEEATYPEEGEEDRNAEDITVTEFDPNGPVLMYGMANQEVLRIKRFLKAMGYENIPLNFTYDWATVEAVRDYQRKNNLVSDGIVGRNTYGAMNRDMKENRLEIPEVSVAFTKNPEETEWIIINLSGNMLYHMDGKNILKAYPVATGKLAGYTPEGSFRVVNKLVNPAWGGAGRMPPVAGGSPDNPLGKRWMGLDIGGGYTYGIHGNNDENSIGKYVSLGCIRMHNSDSEELFEKVFIGMKVVIGTDITLASYGIYFQ
ncbi:MAG: murein L,D-transpeptidase [Clostridiaceae bacterium]|jgi:murein L,D-transpeptidase YcbB/YkuD|nr:murein L,D-transpeptidase [Clostridiaceae bacterium]